MRIAYLDCFAGISGDMFLGALIAAGVPFAVLEDATRALNLNASLKREIVDRSGISSTKIHVFEGAELAEPDHQQTQQPHTHQPKTQHLHKTGHTHEHEHTHEDVHTDEPEPTHTHGRSLTVIRDLIQTARLAAPVKSLAIRTFELLGNSEAKIHNVPVDQIHFHEVGAVDAIVDIVAASAGIVYLNIGAWYASPVNVGGGTVVCAHGTFPVPAPATADLLRGFPTYSAHIEKELVTPTGAALLRALAPAFGPQPPMVVGQIGYGAGSRNPAGFPNVLRLSVGESTSAEAASGQTSEVIVLETAIDDQSPQILAYVCEQALKLGALDVMSSAVNMKKGRVGTLITVLTDPANRAALEHLLLTETSTLGLRISHQQRITLARRHEQVVTPYGPIRIKIGTSHEGTDSNAAPEFEDCRTAASTHNVPIKQVMQAALAAWSARP
jgi:uncharacterized protein (TIGR00299 family) protein